jgi:hypothetical protein
MFAPEEKAASEYAGRTGCAVDTDDGSGAVMEACGERWFVVDFEVVRDSMVPLLFGEDCHGR